MSIDSPKISTMAPAATPDLIPTPGKSYPEPTNAL